MAEKIGAGNKPQNYDEKSGKYGKTDFFKEAEKAVTLSKQEWARYYEKIGEIKANMFTPIFTDKGERIIVLDNKLIVDNNKFEKPKVKLIKTFLSEDDLYDFISDLKGC